MPRRKKSMRCFRKKGKKLMRQWTIWVDGPEVHMEWGAVDGRMQQTFDTPGPSGKKGTKAYLTPEANALVQAEIEIRKKVEKGYFEVDATTGVRLGSAADELDFKTLPKNLSFWKPRKQPHEEVKADLKELARMEAALGSESCIITVKRDGFMHPILVDDKGKVRIFTRRMDEHTDKYPALVCDLQSANLPKRSIILAELTVVDSRGRDDRLLMQSVSNSKPERARELQRKGADITPIFLSIPFWDGEDLVSTRTFGDQIEFLEEQFGVPSRRPPRSEIMEVWYGTFEEAIDYVENSELNREGLVIYDGNAIPGEQGYNFRGHPERPPAWKWKPYHEDDFLLVWDPDGKYGWEKGGSYGKGKRQNLPKSVALYQRNVAGEYVYICLCGSGFDDEELPRLRDDATKWKGICGVAQVKFASRRYVNDGDKSNALVEPIYVGMHADKGPDEVINERL